MQYPSKVEGYLRPLLLGHPLEPRKSPNRKPVEVGASHSHSSRDTAISTSAVPLSIMIMDLTWRFMGNCKCRVPILITHVRGLRTPLITSHEPPSKGCSRILLQIVQTQA